MEAEMKNPSIPMSPDQLPQQRIVPVASIPARPNPFDAFVGWNEKPDGVVLANGPSNPEYLGQVEWAWSRMKNRVDAYYISRGRSHWMLWLYSYDDNWGKWDWLPIGYVPRKNISLDQAAFHLLIDFWRWDKEKGDLDHYHWLNEEGYLDASQWRTIALLVWNADPEGGGKNE
jgi:hypothetical protein